MKKKVVVVGAFDTKATEYKFVIDLIKKKGLAVITINTGVLGATDLFNIDIAADVVAQAGNSSLEAIRAENDRGKAITVMSAGLGTLLSELFSKDKFDGIIGLGGSAGTNVVSSGMRALPYGLPKVCVSTVASGNVSPYVGISDIVMIPSLTDIAGLHALSRMVFINAVGALIGMVESGKDTTGDVLGGKPVIAASMFGNTTPCIDACRGLLARKGYETLVFHATGAGGKTMEKLVREGVVQAVLDITTTEWADTLCGGVFDAGSERLDSPGEVGIPHLIAPGCIDMCNFGSPDTIPAIYKDRLFYQWNPQVTLMRTTVEENRRLGEIFAEKANKSKGNVLFAIPLKGYSILDSVNEQGESQLFWDPQADNAFIDGLKSKLRPTVEVVEIDANINSPSFSRETVDLLLQML